MIIQNGFKGKFLLLTLKIRRSGGNDPILTEKDTIHLFHMQFVLIQHNTEGNSANFLSIQDDIFLHLGNSALDRKRSVIVDDFASGIFHDFPIRNTILNMTIFISI